MRLRSSESAPTGFVALMLALISVSAAAQSADPTAAHTAHSNSDAPAASADTAQLQQEISKLREQMRLLEQRMQPSAGGSGQRSRGMEPMGSQNKGSMSPMQSPMKMGGMMDDDMMGMGAMGGMNSPAAMATPSALPGFPGQSHVYHIGAADFYLDHAQHVALTTSQQQRLGQQKQQSLLKQGEQQRQIEAAEQELWQLTAADQPQIGRIEAKAREIERLRADKRIAFIRAVGEAATVLTDEQRQQLTGFASARASTDQATMPMADKKPKDSMEHM